MENMLVKWTGPNKIKGIIAVRTVFGLGLKQAINLMNADDGFVISQLQWIALRGEYMLKRGSFEDRNVYDWMVEHYIPRSNPINLVDHICREVIKTGNTT